MAGFYMSNLPGQMFRPDPQTNEWTLALPTPPSSASIPLFDTGADTGKYVKGILLNREKSLGKRFYAAVKYYSMNEIVEDFKAVKPEAGKGAKAVEISGEMFKGFMAQGGMPEEVQEEMLQNMLLLDMFGYFGGASLEESQSVSL